MDKWRRAGSKRLGKRLRTDGLLASGTSCDVAERFGKRHDHVLRDIRELEMSPDLGASWFRPADTLDAYGREQPSYDLTRDGFTLLVIGPGIEVQNPSSGILKDDAIEAAAAQKAHGAEITHTAESPHPEVAETAIGEIRQCCPSWSVFATGEFGPVLSVWARRACPIVGSGTAATCPFSAPCDFWTPCLPAGVGEPSGFRIVRFPDTSPSPRAAATLCTPAVGDSAAGGR